LFKMGCKFIFLFSIFYEELLHAAETMAEIAQGLKDKVLRKKFVLPIESWFFTFFFC
jgi:hypothetical protein